MYIKEEFDASFEETVEPNIKPLIFKENGVNGTIDSKDHLVIKEEILQDEMVSKCLYKDHSLYFLLFSNTTVYVLVFTQVI